MTPNAPFEHPRYPPEQRPHRDAGNPRPRYLALSARRHSDSAERCASARFAIEGNESPTRLLEKNVKMSFEFWSFGAMRVYTCFVLCYPRFYISVACDLF
jgi:hypothetical protein